MDLPKNISPFNAPSGMLFSEIFLVWGYIPYHPVYLGLWWVKTQINKNQRAYNTAYISIN